MPENAVDLTTNHQAMVKITNAGTYSFMLEADDSAKLYADGNQLLEAKTPDGKMTFTGDISAGLKHFQMDH